VIELREVSKTYETAERTVHAVKTTDLYVPGGTITGLVGFSGAGKSTLLRLINLLERPTSGKVVVDGCELTALNEKRLRRERRNVGVIFQGFNLLAGRTALGNVVFPLEVAGVDRAERRRRGMDSLERVGLAEEAAAYPAQLSGGQKQRVGIARALVNDPKVLLSDEATSALDPHTTLTILQLLRQLNAELGLTILVVTHEINVVNYLCHRVAVMERGTIIERFDLTGEIPAPSTPLGRFLFDSARGWDDETATLARQVAEATT
jgi:D-methionine transport system ATP-binding protein